MVFLLRLAPVKESVAPKQCRGNLAQEVRDALSELESANQELSGIIEKVSNEHRHRAEIVRHHPHEVGLERQVGSSGTILENQGNHAA